MTGTLTTRRVLGAVLVVVAAGLAVAATFLSAYSVQIVLAGRELRYEATFWAVERDDFRELLVLEPFELGEPVVGAALVMALAAVLAFRIPALRVGSLLGAGLLAGVAWAAVSRIQGLLKMMGEFNARVPIEVEQGEGVTLLIVAAGVAVVAAVLHQELPRVDRMEPSGDGVVVHQIDDEADDTDTPPYGYPVIVEPKSD
ncbi:hypothetical protein [Lentzea californiensis]|uniref:hypothetical protein n=1 Tax=Lentzea californiensis TaxID=438851 RepID=UPI0021658A0D|nr:hypothetical protein [Lentzea californiensis]MCR3753380.1 hypothetical protein [Lentzea californiensis]